LVPSAQVSLFPGTHHVPRLIHISIQPFSL